MVLLFPRIEFLQLIDKTIEKVVGLPGPCYSSFSEKFSIREFGDAVAVLEKCLFSDPAVAAGSGTVSVVFRCESFHFVLYHTAKILAWPSEQESATPAVQATTVSNFLFFLTTNQRNHCTIFNV